MSSIPELAVYNHQDVFDFPLGLLDRFESSARIAIPMVLAVARHKNSALSMLDEIEVSLIDDATIADIHLRFMDIPGATDVITFDHGEIHVSVETAQSQAKEFGNDMEREMMLYIVHGLLHLGGYEDASEEGHATMNQLQQRILSEIWLG